MHNDLHFPEWFHWSNLPKIEQEANHFLAQQLKPFELLLGHISELARMAADLPAKRHYEFDMGVAAQVLKRILTDARAVWLLTSTGYTLQATTIAGSLFENSLLLSHIVGSKERAEHFRERDYYLNNWRVRGLTESYIDELSNRFGEVKREFLVMQEANLRAVYSCFCQVKHPSPQAMSHETLSATDEDGFGLIAHPHGNQADSDLKIFVLVETGRLAALALISFMVGLDLSESENKKIFDSQMLMMSEELSRLTAIQEKKGLPMIFKDNPEHYDSFILQARKRHEARGQ